MVAYLRDRTRLAATRYMKRHMFVKKVQCQTPMLPMFTVAHTAICVGPFLERFSPPPLQTAVKVSCYVLIFITRSTRGPSHYLTNFESYGVVNSA